VRGELLERVLPRALGLRETDMDMIARMVAQITLGLTLLFGTATLLPRGVGNLRAGRTGRAVMYIALGVILAFFAVLSFHYAYWAYRAG
jgi:hypothetical protein